MLGPGARLLLTSATPGATQPQGYGCQYGFNYSNSPGNDNS